MTLTYYMKKETTSTGSSLLLFMKPCLLSLCWPTSTMPTTLSNHPQPRIILIFWATTKPAFSNMHAVKPAIIYFFLPNILNHFGFYSFSVQQVRDDIHPRWTAWRDQVSGSGRLSVPFCSQLVMLSWSWSSKKRMDEPSKETFLNQESMSNQDFVSQLTRYYHFILLPSFSFNIGSLFEILLILFLSAFAWTKCCRSKNKSYFSWFLVFLW